MATQPMQTDDGRLIWRVYMGSAVVDVMRLPRPGCRPDDAPIRVATASPESSSRSDVLTTLNLVSGRDSLHKLYWTNEP